MSWQVLFVSYDETDSLTGRWICVCETVSWFVCLLSGSSVFTHTNLLLIKLAFSQQQLTVLCVCVCAHITWHWCPPKPRLLLLFFHWVSEKTTTSLNTADREKMMMWICELQLRYLWSNHMSASPAFFFTEVLPVWCMAFETWSIYFKGTVHPKMSHQRCLP